MNRQRTDTITGSRGETTAPDVSLLYLFLTFLKLGATAFGGYMSLVAMVQKQLVDLDKKLKEEDLLDGITLTSVLPGPVAVNVIAYIGYRLRGISGAAVAFTGIILPSFCLVAGLSWLYFTYGNVPVVKNIFSGITPAITALILTVAWSMARKTMRLPMQWVIGGIAALLLGTIGGFGLTVGLIGGSGVLGYMLFRLPPQERNNAGIVLSGMSSEPFGTEKGESPAFMRSKAEEAKTPVASVEAIRIGARRERAEVKKGKRVSKGFLAGRGRTVAFFLGVILLGGVLLIWEGQKGGGPIGLQIVSVFAGSSLTLFGGGYVVIPALHELFVENLHWLSAAEFADGIAIGQITPGPIFITAAFIGYKVAGLGGAWLATLAMFTPPAVVTVLLSRLVGLLKDSASVKAVMKGIRAAVIGMIFASALTIGQTIDYSLPAVLLFLITLAISFKYTISPVYLILGAGLAGLILF